MSNSAKRTDVNRTATRRRAGGSSAIGSTSDTTDEQVVDPAVQDTEAAVSEEAAVATDKPEKELSERARRRQAKKAMQMGNPSWFVPVMLTLFLIGLVWIVVFYLSQMAYPIPNITWWNLVIGFGFLMLGFAMTTRWK